MTKPTPHIFVSSTSKDLGSYRKIVAETLSKKAVLPIIQDYFGTSADTLPQMIQKKIADCDAVICLIGFVFGAEPAKPFADNEHRSYTQLEFDYARKLKKPIYLCLATEQCKFDDTMDEIEESAALKASQLAYRQNLESTDNMRYYFHSPQELENIISHLPYDWRPQHKPCNLPRTIGRLFKGREDFLDKLRKTLVNPGAHTAVVGAKAIYGLGGIGKTQTVVEYAWQHQEEHSALLFVVADTPETLQRNIAGLIGPLEITLPADRGNLEEEQFKAVIKWLKDNPGWFLILDNVDTLEAQDKVNKILDELTQGYVVITSRIKDWRTGVEPLELDVLSSEAAIAYLDESTQAQRLNTSQDNADVAELVKALGCLALALEQAGAYIRYEQCSYRNYLTLWRSADEDVIAWHDPQILQYPRSVATTWETTLARLSPSARCLMRMLSFLAPEIIPDELFKNWQGVPVFAAIVDEEMRITGQTQELTEQGVTPLPIKILNKALSELARFSMLSKQGGQSSEHHTGVKVHRLVQEMTRARMQEETKQRMLAGTLTWLDSSRPKELAPGNSDTWDWWLPMYPHVRALAHYGDAEGILPLTVALLMNALGLFCTARQLFDEAEALHRRCIAIYEAALGSDHSNISACLCCLSSVLHEVGRTAEAEQMLLRALDIDFKNQHADAVIYDLSSLANLLRYSKGRRADAESYFRQAIATCYSVYGNKNPSQLASQLSNLADFLIEIGRHEEAQTQLSHALIITENHVGLDYIDMAPLLISQANLYRIDSRYAEAEKAYSHALYIAEKTFGSDHPNVIGYLNGLTQLLCDMGRHGLAEPLLRRALAIVENMYAINSVEVANSLEWLGNLLRDTG